MSLPKSIRISIPSSKTWGARKKYGEMLKAIKHINRIDHIPVKIKTFLIYFTLGLLLCKM